MEEVSESVPIFLQQSGFSNVLLVKPSVVGSTLKIVTSPTNDCLYEVKNNKISNILKLNEEVKKVDYAYLIENDQLVLFYVVLTSIKLFIVKRFDFRLEVVKVCDNVEDFHLHDFMCLGYPQIEVEFRGSSKSKIKFPIDDVKTCVGKANLIAMDLSEELQTVCRHVEGLSAEWNRMRVLLEEDINLEDCNTFPVSSLKFSSPLKECIADVIVTSTKKSMLQDKLILEMTIQNKGKKALSDLGLKIYEKNIKEYSYSFLSTSDVVKHVESAFFSTRTKPPSVAPEESISVFGAISTAQLNFAFRTKILITCCVTSGKLKDYLVKETFEITFKDVLDKFSDVYRSQKWRICLFTLQALRVAKTETKLKIQAKCLTRSKFTEILRNDFGFEELCAEKLYYSRSPYLNDVFVYLREESVDETIWKIIFYTSDDSQVYYLVNMLLELLPEYATILYDEDE